MKLCTKCNVEKPLDNFHKDSRTKDGKRCCCKECATIMSKNHYTKNKDEVLLKMKEYGIKNRIEISLKKKEYGDNNKEKIKEKNTSYYKNNKEKIFEKNKERNELVKLW